MKAESLSVLLVEDESGYARLLQEALAGSAHPVIHLRRASTLAAGIGELRQHRFDMVLLDLSLPDSQGFATFTALRAAAPSLPVIVLTGIDDEQLAVDAVREGAQDYLVKAHFDTSSLGRVIRYAIERRRIEEKLREREEFFRLITENVSDLIAVLDKDGRRLYNSPSYYQLLGNPARLPGTDSFEEIHPEDRDRIQKAFKETLATGRGLRTEYRLIGRDGTIRHIESHGSVVRDQSGKPSKVVVVSRDITERKQAVETLREALGDLKRSHEELKAAQLQVVQSERLEAVSTFAAGVAHEVRNPLQTIILGVDYLANHVASADETTVSVLNDMSEAVLRADAIIRGLVEFSAHSKRNITDENLNALIEQSLQAVSGELRNHPIRLQVALDQSVPSLRIDSRTIKHVMINLFLYCIRAMRSGGVLAVRTSSRELAEPLALDGRPVPHFRPGDTIVTAEVEDTADHESEPKTETITLAKRAGRKDLSGVGLLVLKKIIELYGGIFHIAQHRRGSKFTLVFKASKG